MRRNVRYDVFLAGWMLFAVMLASCHSSSKKPPACLKSCATCSCLDAGASAETSPGSAASTQANHPEK